MRVLREQKARERGEKWWRADSGPPSHEEIIEVRHKRREEDKAAAARIRKRDAAGAGVTEGDLVRRQKLVGWVCRNLPVEHPLRQEDLPSRHADVAAMRAWCAKIESVMRSGVAA